MITQFPQSPISPWIFYMILPYDVVLSMLKSHSLWYFIHLIFIPFILLPTLHLILFHMQSIASHYFFIFTYDYASYLLSRISSENFFSPFFLFNKKECYSKKREWACHSLEIEWGNCVSIGVISAAFEAVNSQVYRIRNRVAMSSDSLVRWLSTYNPKFDTFPLNPISLFSYYGQIAHFIPLIFLEHLQLLERWVKMSRKFMKIRTAVKRDEERIKKFIKVANHSLEWAF